MGYNATVVVMLDGLHVIEEHPKEFVDNLVRAIQECTFPNEHEHYRKWVPCCGHCNVAEVVEGHHADNTAVVLVGGNCGSVVDLFPTYRHNELEQQEKMLKAALAKVRFAVRAARKKIKGDKK